MGKQTIKFIALLLILIAATASVCPGQEAAVQSQATATSPLPPRDAAAERQRAMAQKKSEDRESPLSAHKINYFTANRIPTDPESQIKFQVSAKYRIFNWMGSVPGGHLSPYFAYSQKSLWNYGQASKPFEESNYNPEFFVDYRTDREFGSFVFRNIFLSPFEHESNGLAGPQSRSWNRAYIAFRAGLFPIGEKVTAANPADRFEIYLKLWHPWGYSDEEVYLQSIGSTSRFLDFAGRGELQVRARLVNGDWGNQLNATTRIIHDSTRNTLELEFLQRIADWNIIPYVQYWRGYNETLLRFDQFQRRVFVGFALWY